MTAPLPPFTPARATFPCPALVAAAARAPLGGARETLLGAVMAARLVHGLQRPWQLPAAARAARAEGARLWLAALAVPARARTAFQRAFATSASGDATAAADALEAVTEVTAAHLDRAARSELARLVTALRAQADQLAGDAERSVE